MPTNRRHRMRTRRAAVTERNKWRDFQLITGVPPFGDCLFGSDAEAIRAYWKEQGEAIVRDEAVSHPGERPSAWWTFDAPAEARDGESELEYLKRHGLLLPGEAEARREKRTIERAYLTTYQPKLQLPDDFIDL